jgi:hypothetical protein
MPKAVAHDRADTLLGLLGVKVAHPLTQAGAESNPGGASTLAGAR